MPQARKPASPPRRSVPRDRPVAPNAGGKVAIVLGLDADRVHRIQAIAEAENRSFTIYVETAEAARLNRSRYFALRLDVLARLPLTRASFPDIKRANQGVVAVAPVSLQEDITRIASKTISGGAQHYRQPVPLPEPRR